jgi:hypothetical protein
MCVEVTTDICVSIRLIVFLFLSFVCLFFVTSAALLMDASSLSASDLVPIGPILPVFR